MESLRTHLIGTFVTESFKSPLPNFVMSVCLSARLSACNVSMDFHEIFSFGVLLEFVDIFQLPYDASQLL
jgi:hypothetical protein